MESIRTSQKAQQCNVTAKEITDVTRVVEALSLPTDFEKLRRPMLRVLQQVSEPGVHAYVRLVILDGCLSGFVPAIKAIAHAQAPKLIEFQQSVHTRLNQFEASVSSDERKKVLESMPKSLRESGTFL